MLPRAELGPALLPGAGDRVPKSVLLGASDDLLHTSADLLCTSADLLHAYKWGPSCRAASSGDTTAAGHDAAAAGCGWKVHAATPDGRRQE